MTQDNVEVFVLKAMQKCVLNTIKCQTVIDRLARKSKAFYKLLIPQVNKRF